MNKSIFLGFIGILLYSACGEKTQNKLIENNQLEDAYLLQLEEKEGITIASIRNPWDTTSTLHTYILVPDTLEISDYLPSGTLIRTPLKHIGVSTTVHCGLMEELGCKTSIVGVFDAKFIHHHWIKDGLKKETIKDFGNSLNPTLEKIIETAPDALFLTPFENNGGYGRLAQTGIPIIECAEYMETSPLGEAEWVRFFSALMGCPERGDSIFRQVKKSYQKLKQLAAQAQHRPKVLTEMMLSSTWYLPGGKSTTGCLLHDAGAQYIYASTSESGSLARSFEQVFSAAQDADIWLIKYNQNTPISYDEMEKNYTPYSHFKAFQERNIWGCNLDTSNFYEDTPFHPEKALQDYVSIFHPELCSKEPIYFTRIP